MTNTGIRGALHIAVMISAMAIVTGCSSTPTHWSDAKQPPSGYVFSNGMAPSSEGPPPIWYARRFNLPRGLGEAIKQYRESVWERGPGTFAYFVGGKFYAQYQPWQHYLQIRSDNEGQVNVSCHWDANGVLTISEVGGGKAPAGAETTCKQLLGQLESYVAPEWMVAHNKH